MAKKKVRKSVQIQGQKVREYSTFVETGMYVDVKDGKTTIKEVLGAPGEQIPNGFFDKVRVTRHVEEFKGSAPSGITYAKTIFPEQTRTSTNTPQETFSTSMGAPDGTVRPGMDKADYLKNFMDNIAADVRSEKPWTRAALVIGACALVAAATALIYVLA